jgi:SAM-dependent methyltransferase
MQLGLRERFEYGLCGTCGAVTRLSAVSNLEPYYPPDYYPFTQRPVQSKDFPIKMWLKDQRDRILLAQGHYFFGRFLSRVSRRETTMLYQLLGKCRIGFSSRILDIGCGSGHLLRRMAELGFRDLTGVDLFIPENAIPKLKGITFIKGEAKQLEGQTFDLIMLHHFLEHCDDPLDQLKLACNLLSARGVLLIRQPLCDSEAFQRYGMNWCQLDAPRHAVLHSLISMRLLANKSGLRIQDIVWDSTDFQFWASEQYALDVALYDLKSYLLNPEGSLFSAKQIDQWKREAARLNRIGLGDQAAFFFERES